MSLTITAATADTTMETVYGTLMAGFLGLFLTTLLLLVRPRSGPQPSNSQLPQHTSEPVTDVAPAELTWFQTRNSAANGVRCCKANDFVSSENNSKDKR